MEDEKRALFRIGEATALALLLLSLTFSLFLSSCGPGRGAVASNAAFGYCPVCHMKVKASDDWTAEIYYRDGTKLMFESPGDMLAFYTSPDRYDVDAAHKDTANIQSIAVKDYQSKRSIDARQARLIYKSKIEGPMGADFLPFGTREEADAFIAANGGTALSLNEVTREMARDLRK